MWITPIAVQLPEPPLKRRYRTPRGRPTPVGTADASVTVHVVVDVEFKTVAVIGLAAVAAAGIRLVRGGDKPTRRDAKKRLRKRRPTPTGVRSNEQWLRQPPEPLEHPHLHGEHSQRNRLDKSSPRMLQAKSE